MTHRIYRWSVADRRELTYQWHGTYADITVDHDQWTFMLEAYRFIRKSGMHKHAARLTWWRLHEGTYVVDSFVEGNLQVEAVA